MKDFFKNYGNLMMFGQPSNRTQEQKDYINSKRELRKTKRKLNKSLGKLKVQARKLKKFR